MFASIAAAATSTDTAFLHQEQDQDNHHRELANDIVNGEIIRYDSSSALAVGDLDKDGKTDVVMGGDGYIIIAWNDDNNNGVAGNMFDLDVNLEWKDEYSGDVESLIVLDVNNDGYLDIIAGHTTGYNDYNMYLYRNLGGPGSSRQFTKVGIYRRNSIDDRYIDDIVVGDINNDGFMDVIFAVNYDHCSEGGLLLYMLNNQNGGFGSSVIISSNLQSDCTNPTYIQAVDFNNDGKVDVILKDTNRKVIEIYLNEYNPSTDIVSFQLVVVDENIGSYKFGRVAVGDFNNDGYQDILLADMVYIQNPGSTDLVSFHPKGKLLGAQYVISHSHNNVIDFDNDGILDIIAEEYWIKIVQFDDENNNIKGAKGRFINLPDVGLLAAFADFNNDGILDGIFSTLDQTTRYIDGTNFNLVDDVTFQPTQSPTTSFPSSTPTASMAPTVPGYCDGGFETINCARVYRENSCLGCGTNCWDRYDDCNERCGYKYTGCSCDINFDLCSAFTTGNAFIRYVY